MTAPDSAKLHAARLAKLSAFTDGMRAKHDALETPAAKAVRVRRALLSQARKSLQAMHGQPDLKLVIGIILDELESK
jgi:hypothetical protein